MTTREKMMRSLNRLCKWRMVLAGWQLGTRPEDDIETKAVRYAADRSLVLRAELTALTRILIEHKVIDLDEWMTLVGEEAEHLSEALSRQFPGFMATDAGMKINPVVAQQTMKGWKP